MKNSKHLLWITILLLITSCKGSGEIADPQSSLGNVPVKILISEVFTGVDGNNQADFIELYNSGTTIADLNGYTLWYQLNDSSDEIILYQWTEETLVPPPGILCPDPSQSTLCDPARRDHQSTLGPESGRIVSARRRPDRRSAQLGHRSWSYGRRPPCP